MRELETVQLLQNYIEDLHKNIKVLENDVQHLMPIISGDKFIPEELNNSVKKSLDNITDIQHNFFSKYGTLGLTDVPNSISASNDRLNIYKKEIEDKVEYIEAVSFFNTIHSKDIKIEELLVAEKKNLNQFSSKST